MGRYCLSPCRTGWLRSELKPKSITHFSPDIISRIDNYLDTASDTDFKAEKPVLGINQVLVNEYAPGQGISVSACRYSSSKRHQ